MFGVEVIFDFESNGSRELLSSFAYYQVMIGLFQHCLGHQRRSPDSFERGHGARLLPRAMHAGRIELDYTLGIWQASIPDAVIQRVELYYVDPGDDRVQYVL